MAVAEANDPDTLHRHFVATARGVSLPLCDALAGLGPITLPRHDRRDFGAYIGRVIIGQQLSPAAASTIWGRIETRAADVGETLPGFFRAEQAENIRACGVSRAKVNALLGIGGAAAAGEFDRRALRGLSEEERRRRLLALPGVGPWTCDMISLFYFGSPDIWPAGDLAVQRTFRELIGRRSPDRAAARFSPHRSYLAVAMWKLVEGDA